MARFTDGLRDIFSGLAKKRSGTGRNVVESRKLDDHELKTMYRSGLMSKIIRLKTGYALNDTIHFSSTDDKDFYNKVLAAEVKKASKFMLGFGRGALVLFSKGDDLSTPLIMGNRDLLIRGFSGDMIKADNPQTDLTHPRYSKPLTYSVNGKQIHWSRVVDFTYYMPVELDLPNYQYGGISESELIYTEFVNDGIVQRASGTIIDKASTFVYKIKNYKESIAMKKDKDIVEYISTCEDGRSIYGALITDADDSIEVLTQTLADLDKVDDITLRRLSMVTGLGRTVLIGEQAGGLNADGKSERQGFQDTIENLQSDYLLEPINYLAKAFGIGEIRFKDNQGQTPVDKIEFETKAVTNAKMLWEMGEDYKAYLDEKGVTQKDDWESFWSEDNE